MSPGWIQTVKGAVAVKDLGLILPHEHLFTDLRGPLVPDYALAEREAVARVKILMETYCDRQKNNVCTFLREPGIFPRIAYCRGQGRTPSGVERVGTRCPDA